MSEYMYVYPVWVRLWHGFNALLILTLAATGFSMHYSDSLSGFISFAVARKVHDGAAIMLILSYLGYCIGSIVTGNIKHYIPRMHNLVKNLFIQARYYAWGIFLKEEHPFKATPNSKFNPLQQITYAAIMYALMPFVIFTGILLLVPQHLPAQI